MQKLLIIAFILVIVWNLGAGLYYMMVDKGKSDRTVKSLSWRIGLSVLLILLVVAGILGNSTNYAIGRRFGHLAQAGRFPFVNREHLRETEEYFARHGALTIVLSRFAPILRTFAPFVAGVGTMSYRRFFLYNVVGALVWVGLFLAAGYLFGNLPFVKRNFSKVILAIIVVSVLPIVWEWWKHRRASAKARS